MKRVSLRSKITRREKSRDRFGEVFIDGDGDGEAIMKLRKTFHTIMKLKHLQVSCVDLGGR